MWFLQLPSGVLLQRNKWSKNEITGNEEKGVWERKRQRRNKRENGKETKQIGWEWFLPFTRLWALVSKKAETNWKRRGWGMTETRTSRRTHSRGSVASRSFILLLYYSRAGVRITLSEFLLHSLSLSALEIWHWHFALEIWNSFFFCGNSVRWC